MTCSGASASAPESTGESDKKSGASPPPDAPPVASKTPAEVTKEAREAKKKEAEAKKKFLSKNKPVKVYGPLCQIFDLRVKFDEIRVFFFFHGIIFDRLSIVNNGNWGPLCVLPAGTVFPCRPLYTPTTLFYEDTA